MPSSKRSRKDDAPLELGCEWGSCEESLDRMEDFCKHVECHLKALNIPDGDSYPLGKSRVVSRGLYEKANGSVFRERQTQNRKIRTSVC